MKEKIENAIGLVYTVVEALCRLNVFLLYFSNAILLVVSLCMIRYGFFLMEKTNSKFTITGLPRRYLYLVTVISGILCLVMVVAKFFGMFHTKSTDNFLESKSELEN